ncbi:hypothetical protein DRO03_00055 [Methanosarcinales archaeon]|nr:MAG: hypothetical protein DRO03_00055 [Methanosarcinales archaeon]
MPERKLTIEVGIGDDAVNSIEDLGPRKYLDSLQDDMAQQAKMRKGSKKVHIRTPHFEFDFHAKRTLDEAGKKRS